MPKAKSQQQAKLFGHIAGGGNHRFEKFSPSEARERLKGVKVSKLPKRKGLISRAVRKRKNNPHKY